MADFEKALDWEDEIVKESEFVLLPEGDYDFKVVGLKRARHEGSKNLPPCNKAELEIDVSGPQGKATIFHNLFLHTKTEWALSAFFIAIGQKKHDEPLRMNWNKVVGSTGRCKVCIDTWTNDKGEEHQSNKIKRFYEPSDAPKFQAGQF